MYNLLYNDIYICEHMIYIYNMISHIYIYTYDYNIMCIYIYVHTHISVLVAIHTNVFVYSLVTQGAK